LIRTTSGNPRNDGPGLRLRRALAERFYASLPYRLSLAWRRPEGIALVPVDPWPGQAAQADRMFQGRFHFAGEEIH
jgi:uncharacterized heparinase superfamily protein